MDVLVEAYMRHMFNSKGRAYKDKDFRSPSYSPYGHGNDMGDAPPLKKLDGYF